MKKKMGKRADVKLLSAPLICKHGWSIFCRFIDPFLAKADQVVNISFAIPICMQCCPPPLSYTPPFSAGGSVTCKTIK